MSAYSATSRSVTFSPLPPMSSGNRPTGGGGSEPPEPVADDGQVRLEVSQPARRGPELVAVLLVVAIEPARSDTEDEPPVADVVDGARHVGEQARVAVRVARDERAELRGRRLRRDRAEQRVRLEVRRVGVAVEREEVVPHPDAVDEGVGGARRVAQRGDRRRLRVELYADLELCHRALTAALS